MYVCLCNGYREADLLEIAGEGIACAIEAYLALGSGPCCGRCLECAQRIIDGTGGGAAVQAAGNGPGRG